MKVTLSIDGSAMRGGQKIGHWYRRYNGKVDRGVKLGDWVGKLPNGVGMTKAKKESLRDWFDANSTEPKP